MTTDIHAATESLRRCLRDGVLPKSGLLSMFDAIAVDTVLKSHDAMETRAELAEQAYVSAAEERDMLRAHRDELLAALEARDAEIAALKEDAERYRVLKEKIRPIYRPGHPRIELYIDGQTIAWHATTDSDRSYSESIDAAIDDARKDGAR
jgi:hypothetical protein